MADARSEFLARRRDYLGGTDLAAILGRHKYRTPLQVWMEKTGRTAESTTSRAAEVGILLEPLAKAWYEQEANVAIQPGSELRHPIHGFLGGNPDGYIGQSAVVEIKTYGATTASEWGESGTDQIPEAYLLQVVWYLHLSGRPHGIVVALHRDKLAFSDYVVDADPELGEEMVRRGVEWWGKHVVADKAPEAVDRRDENAIRLLYPTERGEVVIATPEQDQLASRLHMAYRELNEAEHEFEVLRLRMLEAIGDASGIATAIGEFSYRQSKDAARTDWKRVADALTPAPELVAAHTVVRPGPRRFLTPFLKRDEP
ncbi:MAG: YqaJ viral recombinase family protein [Fimbriimonadaceae bacterium]|nr:YqaJ viral recombinase family protein [Fimbriimonadaceae bacterium]